ncbi:hypothetical protein OPKNFCMD_2201 [Methylobacterium crusticola]|uniref:LTXXQ motif family protein n=1 Tax=Methylobacterium crusticola TaxID=1697972 RepID=A0ABQ4QVT3_9HYPH|nr:Spy/CpxP family protein refolding chaperone [Methylobacterium crusticola]GJD49470.1 hypothetical protein OPKNFCMD_2201 [Methylobacterium crusticola]
MRRMIIGLVGASVAGSACYAQGGDPPAAPGPRAQTVAHADVSDDGHRFGPEDRRAFTEARIAALHAGLTLTPAQEALWPPVEQAIRGLIKVGRDQREAMREHGRDWVATNAPEALRARADGLAARADALRKLADASQPLYATLDQRQKQRAVILARPMGAHPGGMRGGPHHRHDD